jgi:integrase
LAAGYGAVWLPGTLWVKYLNAKREWIWQWVFPAVSLAADPQSVGPGAHGIMRPTLRRHRVNETSVQRVMKAAVLVAQIDRRASCHTLRPSFATHLLAAGYDIRTVQSFAGPQGRKHHANLYACDAATGLGHAESAGGLAPAAAAATAALISSPCCRGRCRRRCWWKAAGR